MNEHDEPSSLRVPPHSREAEQSVLGGLLLDNSAWDRAADLLKESDFYRHEHRLIFGAIGALVNATKPADVITVFEQLECMGKGDECGGIGYLNSLAQSVPSAANMRRYAEIVRERAVLRGLVAVSDTIATAAFNPQGRSVAEILDSAATAMHALEAGHAKKMPRSFQDIVVERLDHISELAQGKVKSGWPTNFPTLDDMLNGGLRPGSVYVLAARPSVGKSALAAAIGTGFAQDGLPTLFLSQEMGDGEVIDRALANIGGIPYKNIQTGQLSDMDWANLSSAAESGAAMPFYVDDQGSLTISEIRSKARSIKGLKLLVLDYLQLSASRGEHSNRNGEIEEVSRGLKSLAKELGIAVLMLSQLNRKVEERPGKRPMLSDLRDSGSIEQDADVVIFLWPLKEFKVGGYWAIGCDLPKNRQGKKGAFAMHFWGDYMRWAESEFRLEDLLGKDKPASAGGGFD